jgi:alpha-ribazole phosphatase
VKLFFTWLPSKSGDISPEKNELMAIYLIRHTAPAIAKGICYGQSDLDVKESFLEEVSSILPHLPNGISRIYSSPLIRCGKLANCLFPGEIILWEPSLMEIHCGIWEMKKWDEIAKEEIDPWMNNFVEQSIPGGESYLVLYERVLAWFNQIKSVQENTVVVTHGGVIRSILSNITQTPLIDSFKIFPLHYGCVVRLNQFDNRIVPEILYNAEPDEKEMHKPSSFYTG